MLSSIMPPQGHKFIPAKQSQRDYGMLFTHLPINNKGKVFTNPNFVNKFNKYENKVNTFDSATKINQNSCQSNIIDSIKEKCPEAIPCVDKDSFLTTPEATEMCLGNGNFKLLKEHQTQREDHHIESRKRHLGKSSKYNEKRRVTSEMRDEEEPQNNLVNSFEIFWSPQVHSLNLEAQKPSTKTMTKELPISNADMIVAITKNLPISRSRQHSTSDSEDSFIVFDYDENNDNSIEDQESLCSRDKKISFCESEDSFILFEGGDVESQNDDDSEYGFDSSDAESNCNEDPPEDSPCDETDSSFSIIEAKKVRFASDHKLCEVHPMIKWSYAYQAARKGPWEMYARDRSRFRDRANRVERDIKHIFDPQHRERIYRERFENM